jgi:anhydro-N-acetylmuramic acid kinase
MKTEYYIGLMSGTSLDGVDAAVLSFSKSAPPTLVATHYTPLPLALKKRLEQHMSAPHRTQEHGALDCEVGGLLATSVSDLLKVAALSAEDITAIGSPGLTLWHAPTAPYPHSLQIGNPHVIAAETHITTVADFRQTDIAFGGQGAPLAPAFHAALWQCPTQNRNIVNIGGMANITQLHQDLNTVIGYDTGPGNTLMDAWVMQHFQRPYDEAGRLAMQGHCLTPLLNTLLSDPYFSAAAPKSTGREYFNRSWFNSRLSGGEDPLDVLATLMALTAHTIVGQALPGPLFVCGGGAHHTPLMALIAALHTGPVATTEAIGMDPDYVEAATFAWFAQQTLTGTPVDLSNITGSQRPLCLGSIYPAQGRKMS